MPQLEVRAPLGIEAEEPCTLCKDLELPKIILAHVVSYVFCPPCALEVAHDLIQAVKRTRHA